MFSECEPQISAADQSYILKVIDTLSHHFSA